MSIMKHFLDLKKSYSFLFKPLTLVLLFLTALPFAAAEKPKHPFINVRNMLGPCCSDMGNDLVVDSEGGVFVVGSRGGLDLDRDGSIDIQTHGSPDSLVFRSDPANEGPWQQEIEKEKRENSKLEWVIGPGGPKADTSSGVALDRRGGIFVVGNFIEKLEIGNVTLKSQGKRDGYLARYDGDGKLLWAKALGGVGEDEFPDVASDSEGNSYVAGTIQGEADLDRDGKIDVTSKGPSAAILASFDPMGKFRWAWNSGGNARVSARSIAVGAKGEIYVGGFYMLGDVDFNGDGAPDAPTAALPKPGARVSAQTDLNGFIVRFKPDGSPLWFTSASGPAMQIVGGFAFAPNGDLFIVGAYSGPVDFNNDGSPELQFKSMGDNKGKYREDMNSFLVRAKPDGKVIWSKRLMAAAHNLAAGKNHLVLSGTYQGDLDLNDDGKIERKADADKEHEGFAAILDMNGEVKRVFTVVGGDSDVVNAAGFSPDERKLYITGYSKLGADFNEDGKVETASACHQIGDLFLAMYDVEDE